ncbi:MAG: hypothetical protein OEW64_01540 [Gammaproteobacteria bacterium]|nr:hypothetical protein [Gammaproteobacteria bacterium]MDH5302763.1 hypothetical protein [Gammaproteobacteria bacterium]MDH5321305.1 hypothetical protein [Gammaproteobacteria bacterium]
MHKLTQHFVSLLAYLVFAIGIGYFSVAPRYQYAAPGAAVVKLSLSHATNRVEPCVRLTPEEVAALAPNMRRDEQCERARLPLQIEIELDGELVLATQAMPSGTWNDGPASIYHKFELPPGDYRLSARLRDSDRTDGWDYAYTGDVSLAAGRYLSITFRAENGGFEVR